MSITCLEKRQTSSQQIMIMILITPGESIVITNKSQSPWTSLTNTPAQRRYLPSTDSNIIEEQKTHLTIMVSSCDDIYESIYHMAQNCPEKRDLYYTQEAFLFQSDFDHCEQIKNLASESWNAAVLDSGDTNKFAGKEWCNCYMSSLRRESKK